MPGAWLPRRALARRIRLGSGGKAVPGLADAKLDGRTGVRTPLLPASEAVTHLRRLLRQHAIPAQSDRSVTSPGGADEDPNRNLACRSELVAGAARVRSGGAAGCLQRA